MDTVSIDVSAVVVVLTLAATTVAILLFAWHTPITTPQALVVLVVTIVLAWVVEAVWRGISKRRPQGEEA